MADNSLIAAVVTLALAATAAIWRLSAIVSTLKSDVQHIRSNELPHLQDDITSLKNGLSALRAKVEEIRVSLAAFTRRVNGKSIE